jgi:carbamate kinase
MLIVIALGGNALLKRGEKLSIGTQEKNVRAAVKSIKNITKKHHAVVSFGNAPQVGNIMIQVESALGKAYPVPLHVAVAESEGEIGYLLVQALHNELKKPVVSILTQVIVDKNDIAFKNPTKPIGPYYSKKEMTILRKKGYVMKKINGGYRRVVASPRPLRIVEAPIIKKLASMNIITIAAGGGGIPVFKKHGLHGIDAVIDKDLASSCLAKSIGAQLLLILTDVPCAYINYGKKNQKELRKLSIKEAKKLLKEGHFPAGSMGPKIQASIEFAESGGKAIITNFASLKKAMKGKAGTIV